MHQFTQTWDLLWTELTVGRLDSVCTCLTKDTRYDIAPSAQRTDGDRDDWAENFTTIVGSFLLSAMVASKVC